MQMGAVTTELIRALGESVPMPDTCLSPLQCWSVFPLSLTTVLRLYLAVGSIRTEVPFLALFPRMLFVLLLTGTPVVAAP